MMTIMTGMIGSKSRCQRNSTLLIQLILILLAISTIGSAFRAPQHAALLYRVEEEKPPFTLVGNVLEDSHLRDKHSDYVLSQLKLELHHSTKSANEYFNLDEETGLLKTRSKIDRDFLCKTATSHCDVLIIDVAVKPMKYFEIIRVKVKVTDINDHRPTFPRDRQEFRILESAAMGTTFPLPTAEDGDNATNGVQIYDIDSTTTVFDMIINNQSDGSLTASLVLKQLLNHEEKDFYRLKVIAWDGGKPQLSGTLLVDIIVLDVNDNHPVFSSQFYEAKVYENALPGSEVFRMSATDADSGSFGEVSYSLSPQSEQSFGQTFRIDNRTGMVYVRGPLDFEIQQIFQLVIIATDRGPNSVPTSARLEIHVLDINDNAPKIQLNALTNSGDAEIVENLDIGTFVAYISVSDPDSGANGRFECTIDSNYFILENSPGFDYKLVSDVVFDREKRDSYDVRLSCVDHGDPQQTSHRMIRVKVTDDNDHRPVFVQAVYYVVFMENHSVGSTVIKLDATDLDIGRNSAIRFSIRAVNSSDNATVDIDSITGLVRAQVVFDYETKSMYEYIVTATDHGSPSKSATATLLLEIKDMNDEPPKFSVQAPYVFHLQENRAPNYFVGFVAATDPDTFPFNQVTYAIEYGIDSPSTDLFEVDPFTGHIYALLPLNRENVAEYRFKIVAGNVGFPNIRSATDVIVYVDDENDNAPVIMFPSVTNRSIQVSTSAREGSVVGKIDAHDSDYGYNGTLTYCAANLPASPIFDVNPTTGAVLVVGDVSNLDQQTFHMLIIVKDGGEPPMETSSDLYLIVNKSAGLLEAAQIGNFLLLGQTEFTIVVAIIVGILITTIIIAAVMCCLKGHRKSSNKRRQQEVNSNVRSENDKLLTTVTLHNGEKKIIKSDDKYAVVVTVNGSNGIREEAIPMSQWKSGDDYELNGFATHENGHHNTLPRHGFNGGHNGSVNHMNRGPSPMPCICPGVSHNYDSSYNNSDCYHSQRNSVNNDPPRKYRISTPNTMGDHCHADRDSESACSGCTDSGKGLSEEGDCCHVISGQGQHHPQQQQQPQYQQSRGSLIRETNSGARGCNSHREPSGTTARHCCHDNRYRLAANSEQQPAASSIRCHRPLFGSFTSHALAVASNRNNTSEKLEFDFPAELRQKSLGRKGKPFEPLMAITSRGHHQQQQQQQPGQLDQWLLQTNAAVYSGD